MRGYKTIKELEDSIYDYKDTFEFHKEKSFDLIKMFEIDMEKKEGMPYSHLRTLLENHVKTF